MGKSNLAVVEQAVRSPVSLVTNSNTIEFGYASVDEAFPAVEPGQAPLGSNALFQIRHPKTRTKGGIWLTQGDRSTEYYNTQVAKVIALGPLCFKAVESSDPRAPTLVDWPEGPWFKPGDFVRVPKYGGDRFEVPYGAEEVDVEGRKIRDFAIFCFFKCKDIISRIESVEHALAMKAFYD